PRGELWLWGRLRLPSRRGAAATGLGFTLCVGASPSGRALALGEAAPAIAAGRCSCGIGLYAVRRSPALGASLGFWLFGRLGCRFRVISIFAFQPCATRSPRFSRIRRNAVRRSAFRLAARPW